MPDLNIPGRCFAADLCVMDPACLFVADCKAVEDDDTDD